MSSKVTPANTGSKLWKNDSARQRWDLFHQAIAHAKASNVANLGDEFELDRAVDESKPVRRGPPVLRLAK